MDDLDDLLEMVELVPRRVEDTLTEIDERELEVQTKSKELDERTTEYFKLAEAGELLPEDIDAKGKSILSDYREVLEISDEKVTLATEMHDMVNRSILKLDEAMQKLKLDIDGRKPGTSETIEKRSLELELTQGEGHKEPKKKCERKNSNEKPGTSGRRPSQQKRGRYARLKSSSDDDDYDDYDDDDYDDEDVNPDPPTSRRSRRKRRNARKEKEEREESPEARYCFCNDIAHGYMIACDAPACPLQWFHYDCVGIARAPRDKWFCGLCSGAIKRWTKPKPAE